MNILKNKLTYFRFRSFKKFRSVKPFTLKNFLKVVDEKNRFKFNNYSSITPRWSTK